MRRGGLADQVSRQKTAALFRRHLKHVQERLAERRGSRVIGASFNEVLDSLVEEAGRLGRSIGGGLGVTATTTAVHWTPHRRRQQHMAPAS
ncbi:MAG: hypothetical protein PVJ64_07830 [Gemmatimonadales bacterium]